MISLRNGRGDVAPTTGCGPMGSMPGSSLVHRPLPETRRCDGDCARNLLASAAVERIGVGVVVVDPQGAVVVANPAAGTLVGRDPRRLTGVPLVDLVHPLDNDRLRQALSGRVAGTATTLRFVHPAGRVVWVRFSAADLPARRGEPGGVVCHLDDVTEPTAQYEEALSRIDVLTDANEVLARSTMVAAHDLATPLRGIAVQVEAMIDDATAAPTAADARLRAVLDEVHRLERLVGGVLRDAGTCPRLDLRECDLRGVIDDAWSALAPLASERQGRLGIGALPTVRCDPDEMTRLFQNLLGNSLVHGPMGVQVSVTAVHEVGGWVLTVTDDGPGIPSAAIDHVFDMFHQADGATSSGTGIGLAVCREIMCRHHGRIWAERNVRGCAISAWLPDASDASDVTDVTDATAVGYDGRH